MDAEVGLRPSWAWRGILEGRELLRKGLRWRIGNGESVRIWDDVWIAKKELVKLWAPRREGLVRDNFSERETKCILATPFSRLGCEDRGLAFREIWAVFGQIRLFIGSKVG
ncbi:hypothetical protein Scep_014830 [Stephania cephalantha]|uniref:Reverse transcriptase n=1 Tax=Stephania cephalantha TaxID=152367 RepID=A0AAP0J203_9MAGN